MENSRDRVFVNMNAGKKVLGVDVRIGIAAVIVLGLAMPILHGIWWPTVIGIVVWLVGAACEKRDPRFFDLLPLRFQLKDRYER